MAAVSHCRERTVDRRARPRVVRSLPQRHQPHRRCRDKLGKAVDAYNQAIGSMESQLRPYLQRFQEATVSSAEVPTLEPLEQTPRLPLDVKE